MRRHVCAGLLVGKTLSVQQALERSQPQDDRKLRGLDPREHQFEHARIEDRARDDELGASLELVLESSDLGIRVFRSCVDGHSQMKCGWIADGLTAHIQSAIQTRYR